LKKKKFSLGVGEKRLFGLVIEKKNQIYAKESKERGKKSAHRFLYLFIPWATSSPHPSRRDFTNTTSHNWISNHLISTACQLLIWTSILASTRPAITLDFSFASHC